MGYFILLGLEIFVKAAKKKTFFTDLWFFALVFQGSLCNNVSVPLTGEQVFSNRQGVFTRSQGSVQVNESCGVSGVGLSVLLGKCFPDRGSVDWGPQGRRSLRKRLSRNCVCFACTEQREDTGSLGALPANSHSTWCVTNINSSHTPLSLCHIAVITDLVHRTYMIIITCMTHSRCKLVFYYVLHCIF